MQVYLNEYNIRMEKSAYLPIASGLLRAFAETNADIKSNYQFQPFNYHMDSMANIMARYQEPSVAGFSVSMWNEQLNLAVAAEVKRRWPDCLIVFGGPQVPQHPQDYFNRYPFVDVAVRAEGEEAFSKILLRNLESRDFSGIPGVSWRRGHECIRNEENSHQPKDLDMYPSPYLEGLFDPIMQSNEYEMQAIIETNRGCLTGDTTIVTFNGVKCIKDVSPLEMVLGYDEGTGHTIWNMVERSVHTGRKRVWLITTKTGHIIRATHDHPIFTKEGWQGASKIKPGTRILQTAPVAGISRQNKDFEEALLQGMPLRDADTTEKQIRAVSLQPDMLNGVLPQTYCPVQTWGKQPHEDSRYAQKGIKDNQEETSCLLQRANEGNLAQASRENDRSKSPVFGSEAFWIRTARNLFSGQAQSTVQIYGGFQILDWAMQIRQEEKSGLHIYQWLKKGLARAWSLLASRPEEERRGDKGLSQQGMGSVPDLGRPTFEFVASEKTNPVCWVEVESVVERGIEDTYDLINAVPFPNFFANGILVHNCPFPCSFCYWGQGGLSRKYRFHGVDRVKLEIEWAAKNKIKYLFNADSNFGMHKRDEEIAQILIDTKREYGFPDKFRTCFGKNADERIYDIASRLHDVELEKGITLALQSNNATVLKNINRQNIKMSAYQSLQRKFNARGVPVYSELILGMPGETMDTWKQGIEELFQAGLRNQLFVYLCQVLPNTEMSELAYQEKHGIKTLRIELNEIHGAVRSSDLTTEYEDIIFTTSVMDVEMWKRMVLFSWVTMVMHSMKVGFFVMLYLHKEKGLRYTDFIEFACKWDGPLWSRELAEFNAQIERLLAGNGRGRIMPGYAPIYWDEEEASFLRISENADAFYREFQQMAEAFAGCDLSEVVTYQRMRIPPIGEVSYTFSNNLPEYFEKVMTEEIALVDTQQTMTVKPKTYADKAQFAKETILWGRKSGTMLTKYETA